jgi:signal peptidase I
MRTTSNANKTVTLSIIAIVLGLFAVKTFFIGYYRIPQNGMYPTLPAGSILFTLKRAYSGTSDVKRGDIVVFVRDQNGKHYNYVWRVIGLPGETVETSGESLMINSQPVRRERVGEVEGKTIFREQIGDISYQIAFDPSARERPPDTTVTVPPEHLFVMGDNRFNAFDSRRFGPIPFSSIIGKKL